ncbi:hypothetical protein DPMN_151075 [Dreissena polymorpha]|uniref:Ig-like domain-containing protein n=1 Tax=Dreissena polymorpha TaxID=45954 RepID=A0A9D4J658_DREPO|nr:hypothetical protein DPMN_151075 [Dreissena polymorpha]
MMSLADTEVLYQPINTQGDIEWIQQPTDLNVTIGGNVTFPCEARYNNQLATWLTWRKDGAVIFVNGEVGIGLGLKMSNRYSVDYADSGRSNLRITKVQLEDEFNFTCFARDQNRIQIEDIGNYTCVVWSVATSQPKSRNVLANTSEKVQCQEST